MNKSYFDSRGKSHELIAVLTAISHVSAKMARNLELLAELRNSKKGNTTYEQHKGHGFEHRRTAACGSRFE